MKKYFLFFIFYFFIFLSSNAQVFVKITEIEIGKENQIMIRYELKNNTPYNYIINHNLVFNPKCGDFQNYTYIQMMENNFPIHVSCFKIENYVPEEKYTIVKSFSSKAYKINMLKIKNKEQIGVKISLIYSKVNRIKIILNQQNKRIEKLEKRFVKLIKKNKAIYFIGNLESEEFDL